MQIAKKYINSAMTINEIAQEYLKIEGYTIKAINYKTVTDQIDIIAEKDSVLTFIIIKTTTKPLIANQKYKMTFTEQQKIRNVAQNYLIQNKQINNMPIMNFDIIEIYINNNKILAFRHNPKAF